MRVLDDDKLRELARKKKVKKTEQSKKSPHPYIQHMAKLEKLIQGIGISNEGTKKILTYVAGIMKNSQTSNIKLLEEITTLQKQLQDLTNSLIIDDSDDVWVAEHERNHQMLMTKTTFRKVTRKGNA